MSADGESYRGGCLCGALRWAATGVPRYMGLCYCADCRKASGSGFIPFIGFAADQLRIDGPSQAFESPAARGGRSTRNFCAICHSLVFGGIAGESDEHTLYAGSLDDPALFAPTMAIFTRDRPAWARVPAGLVLFETMPA